MLELVKTLLLYIVAYLLRLSDYIKIARTANAREISLEGITVERMRIPSRDAGRTIEVIKYSPTGESRPLPVHLNWHASGWVLKRLGIDKHLCIRIARELHCVVFDCDYRKGPENKYPAAQNDTEDAVLYVLAHPSVYDVNNITVSGSSAGGNMALSVSAHLGPQRIKGCVALYPAAVLAKPSEINRVLGRPQTKFRSGIVISSLVMKFFLWAYLKHDADVVERRCSPLFYDVSHYPKHVLIACGDADTLFEGCQRLADKLRSNGSQTHKLLRITGEAHEFNNFAEAPESFEWRDKFEAEAINLIRAARTT